VRPRLGGPTVVLVMISGSHAVIHAYSTLMPWVYPLALVDLGFSVTALGVMVAVANFTGGFLQLGAGALTRVVRRYALIAWGALLLAGATVGTAVATNFAQFSAANVAARVVTSTQHPLGNSLLVDLYSKARRGMAIGGHVAGGNVGTGVLTPVAALLVAYWGWRHTVLLLAIPAALAGLLILLTIREDPGPVPTRSAVRDMASGLRGVLRSRNLALIFTASLIGAGGRGIGVVTLVVPLYLKRQLHVGEPYATGLYTLLLAGSIIGPLGLGRLSDRVGRRPVLVASYALSALFTLSVVMVPATGPWLALTLAAMGLVVYAESPLLQVALADEAPRADRDALFSLYFAVAFGIGALWAAGIGAGLDRLGYPLVFALIASTNAVAGVCVWAMRERR